MIQNYDILTILAFLIATISTCYAFVKFKGPKASILAFGIAMASVALQITAFVVLPLDIMIVN